MPDPIARPKQGTGGDLLGHLGTGAITQQGVFRIGMYYMYVHIHNIYVYIYIYYVYVYVYVYVYICMYILLHYTLPHRGESSGRYAYTSTWILLKREGLHPLYPSQ